MNVYIITYEPFPNGMAATNRIKCYAKALIEEGVSCKVIVFKRATHYGNIIQNICVSSIWEGVPYQYMGNRVYASSNIFVRKIENLLDRVKLMIFLIKTIQKGDIVLGYCGAMTYYINLLIHLIHLKHAQYVKEWCELPGASKGTKKGLQSRRFILEMQLSKCDGIIAISESLKNLADKYISSKTRIIKVPILVEYDKFNMKDCSNLSEVPYIFHSGTLFERKDGILGMIEAFGIAIQKYSRPLDFILTGEIEKSPHATQIRELINKYNLKGRIRFVGYLNDEDLRDYLSKASLVIINKYVTQQNQYCFSTKLAEYLAAEKVVIITKVGEAVYWLNDKESAYIVEPGDTEKLSESIIYALENRELSKEIARNGKELCKRSFDYRCYGKILSDFLKTC